MKQADEIIPLLKVRIDVKALPYTTPTALARATKLILQNGFLENGNRRIAWLNTYGEILPALEIPRVELGGTGHQKWFRVRTVTF